MVVRLQPQKSTAAVRRGPNFLKHQPSVEKNDLYSSPKVQNDDRISAYLRKELFNLFLVYHVKKQMYECNNCDYV